MIPCFHPSCLMLDWSHSEVLIVNWPDSAVHYDPLFPPLMFDVGWARFCSTLWSPVSTPHVWCWMGQILQYFMIPCFHPSCLILDWPDSEVHYDPLFPPLMFDVGLARFWCFICGLARSCSSDVSRRRTSDIDRLKSQNDQLITPPVGQFVPLNFSISGQCPISFQWNRTAPTRSAETKGRRSRSTEKPFEPEFLTGTLARRETGLRSACICHIWLACAVSFLRILCCATYRLPHEFDDSESHATQKKPKVEKGQRFLTGFKGFEKDSAGNESASRPALSKRQHGCSVAEHCQISYWHFPQSVEAGTGSTLATCTHSGCRKRFQFPKLYSDA